MFSFSSKQSSDCPFVEQVTNPELWVDDMASAGVDIFTFHAEIESVGSDLSPLIGKIKSKGMKCGIALKPGSVQFNF